MDGRRHSVDVPISRTLVALRRVKSLRDPTTKSMGKLSAFVENLNWETDKTAAQDDNGVRKSSSRLVSHETAAWLGNGGGLIHTDQSHLDEFAHRSKSLSERYCRDYTKQGLKKSQYRNHHRSRGGDGLNQLVSPAMYEEDEDLDDEDSGSNGCGISSCWLGTPRLRGSNLLQDVEEQPLISGENECWEHNSNGVSEITNSYQKFRPKSFSELVGQNAVATSLMNTVSNGRIHPLYLFHGPRGTGKTSASRIFAAAINCLSPEAEKPCGLCLECVFFFSGRSVDVKEVDCLKLNKMERIRSLMKSAESPPLSSRFKTFIFDECQVLQEDTWGVILNSLDELSQHSVFIMVTPDLDKLPRAAVSRSQKYHFPKIKDSDIADRLGEICAEEGVEFDQDALEFIARKSNGSLRDGEMMLEQLSLLGKRITMPLVYELTGAVSDDELLELLHLALSSDTSKTVKTARELMRSRIDPMQLISQLANLIMDILAGKRVIGGRFSEVGTLQLSHALKILSETEKQLRTSKSQATWLTAALLQLSSVGSSMDTNEGRLCSRTVYPQDVDGNCCSTSTSTGESLKHHATYEREGSESCQLRMEDDKETLTSIWSRAIARCESNSLKNFLQRRGSLSSICLKQGLAIAELKFSHPDYVSTAEKSWKLIANALQQTLCCNVEIRIDLESGPCLRDHASRVKKLSFGLFGCSRREHHRKLPEFSPTEAGSDQSEVSDFASKQVLKKDNVIERCPSTRVSQTPRSRDQPKATVRTIRGNDGNALTVGLELSHNKNFLGLEPERDYGCFPRSVNHLRRSFSSNDSRLMGQPSRNWALSIPKKTSSETLMCASDPRFSCNRSSSCCSRSKDISSKSSRFHCLRAVISPFRKALGLKRRPENGHLQLVMPCTPAAT